MRTLFLLLIAVSGLWVAFESHAQTVYLTPHDLFVDAIEHGQAEGELQGEVAERFTQQFHSHRPLLARVTVIKRYRQTECARLAMVLTQQEVDTPAGQTDAVLNIQLNYCDDGAPPVSLD